MPTNVIIPAAKMTIRIEKLETSRVNKYEKNHTLIKNLKRDHWENSMKHDEYEADTLMPEKAGAS